MLDKWLNKLIEEYFRLFLAVVFLVGVVFLLIAHAFFCPEALWHHLIRDLGIACLVSFFVTIVIEAYSERRREADIRSGVLDAILRKIVHPELWEELKSIMLRPVICKDWHLETTIFKEQITFGGQTKETLVAEGTLTYKLTNQLSQEQRINLKHELEADIKGRDSAGNALPFFKKLSLSTSDSPIEKDALAAKVANNVLEIPTTIPALSTIEVGLTRKEIIQVPASPVWYMVFVTISAMVTIHSEVPDLIFAVRARHPSSEKLRTLIPGVAWFFPGVLLPGQGLEISRSLGEGEKVSAAPTIVKG